MNNHNSYLFSLSTNKNNTSRFSSSQHTLPFSQSSSINSQTSFNSRRRLFNNNRRKKLKKLSLTNLCDCKDDQVINVICLIRQSNPILSTNTKNGHQTTRTHVLVGDPSKRYFTITLWGKKAECVTNLCTGDLVLFIGLQVRTWQHNLTASSTYQTQIIICHDQSQVPCQHMTPKPIESFTSSSISVLHHTKFNTVCTRVKCIYTRLKTTAPYWWLNCWDAWSLSIQLALRMNEILEWKKSHLDFMLGFKQKQHSAIRLHNTPLCELCDNTVVNFIGKVVAINASSAMNSLCASNQKMARPYCSEELEKSLDQLAPPVVTANDRKRQQWTDRKYVIQLFLTDASKRRDSSDSDMSIIQHFNVINNKGVPSSAPRTNFVEEDLHESVCLCLQGETWARTLATWVNQNPLQQKNAPVFECTNVKANFDADSCTFMLQQTGSTELVRLDSKGTEAMKIESRLKAAGQSPYQSLPSVKSLLTYRSNESFAQILHFPARVRAVRFLNYPPLTEKQFQFNAINGCCSASLPTNIVVYTGCARCRRELFPDSNDVFLCDVCPVADKAQADSCYGVFYRPLTLELSECKSPGPLLLKDQQTHLSEEKKNLNSRYKLQSLQHVLQNHIEALRDQSVVPQNNETSTKRKRKFSNFDTSKEISVDDCSVIVSVSSGSAQTLFANISAVSLVPSHQSGSGHANTKKLKCDWEMYLGSLLRAGGARCHWKVRAHTTVDENGMILHRTYELLELEP